MSGFGENAPKRIAGAVVIAENRVNPIERAVFDHARGAQAAFFGGLEKKPETTRKTIMVARQFSGRKKQRRRMAVMAARMHFAWGFRGIGKAGFFRNGQCVHIGAQRDDRPRSPSVEGGHNTGFGNADSDVIPRFSQKFSGEVRCRVFFVSEFRITVQSPTDGSCFGYSLARKNRHIRLSWTVYIH